MGLVRLNILKISLSKVFGTSVRTTKFLKKGTVLFGTVRHLRRQQFARTTIVKFNLFYC